MKNGIGDVITRELMRAMLERTQSFDLKKMMNAFGASEPVKYDDVTETLNVAYVNRDEVALAMDIFKPETEKGTELPVIIVIHGGGLFMGDRGLNRPYCRFLAHRGYLVFSLEYRLAPRANICQQLDDVCAGMDFVGTKLVDYDVDFSRIFLVADSAGAYLAAYVSAMHESEKLQKAIGYKPSRMVYAAVGFITGMFYTNKVLQDQIYGDKRYDESFTKFMFIEHPEIIKNLPPVFMLTSCGDTFNNFSIRFNKALKKAGKVSKLVYFGDEDLQHIFPITNPEHPKSIEGTDKMLAFFEEQADKRRTRLHKNPEVEKNRKKLAKRIQDGSIGAQKVWSNLKERILVDPEHLNRTALIDCTREYTYAQMFEEWERYARVFSALNICSEQGSRVALASAITAEPLFALYALNMTGAEVSMFSYPDFLPGGMWRTMLEKENITDLVISDIMVTPEIWEQLKQAKEELGLRHIILMHSLMGGPTIGPAEMIYNEYNYHLLQSKKGSVFLNDLLDRYSKEPIKYDTSKGERLAFITHTSGTTHGTRKMLPFTDKVFNDSLNMIPGGFHSFLEGRDDGKQLRVIQLFDFSSILALSGQVHVSLSTADTLVLTFFGFMHPKFIRAIDYYNISILLTTGFMVDKWLDNPELDNIDMSSLKVVGMSGGYIPPEKMQVYRDFFHAHGYKYDITAAYGMSEAGGKPMFAPKNNDKDIIGYAEKPEDIRIKDETDGKFYRLKDGPRTGLLYKYSDTRSSNELDGQKLFEYTKIDGKDFLNTNDLVRVNEDGSLSFAGRADKYFVNNQGRKFDSGIVDQNMSLHPSISRCAVVPVMEKRIHDTVPVLYVVPAKKGKDTAESIRKAFVDVYVRDQKIPADNLPTQFMIVDEIPINANGKLDIYRITRERIGGEAYNLKPVFENNKLTDIQTEKVEHVNSMTGGTLPEGMQNNSAYNVFDLFNMKETEKEEEGSFDYEKALDFLFPIRVLFRKGKEFKISPELRKAILKYGNRITSIPNGRVSIDHDFEE